MTVVTVLIGYYLGMTLCVLLRCG